MSVATLRACAVCLPLWLCACASAPAPEDRYFRLIAPELEARAEPRLEGSLLVKRFSGDGLLAQRAVAYADSAAPQALFQYHYQSWSDPPTALLQQLSVDLLRAAGVARMVVTPVHGVVPDYVLVGRIRRLEHLVGESPAVAVALELGLSRESDRRVLLLRSYERVLAVERPGVGAAVAAMNRAVNEVLRQFVADLDAL